MLSVCRRYPPYHYCTSSSLKHWQDAGAFILFIPNCDTTDWMRLRLFFPVLCWPICWSSSASMCWPFRDALLHTMIVMSSYFSYCCLSISLNLPNLLWHQTRDFCPESCCLLDIFFFMDHPLQRCLCWKILADLQFLKSSNQPIWLTALPHLK